MFPSFCISFISSMSQPIQQDPEERTLPGIWHSYLDPPRYFISQVCMVDDPAKDYPGQLRSASDRVSQLQQRGSNFGDSSGPLFSLYSKIAEEQDNKMTHRWKKDADGILIFVSDCIITDTAICMNCNTIDRSIFCLRRCATFGVRPGPQAKLSRYFRVLSREHLSGSCRLKRRCISYIYPFHSCYTTAIFSSEIRCLGQLTLVPKLSHQPHMCSLGHIITTMGTSIHRVHSTIAIKSREASTNACIFCSWSKQDAPSLGS
jgi:hypothetical protein